MEGSHILDLAKHIFCIRLLLLLEYSVRFYFRLFIFILLTVTLDPLSTQFENLQKYI